MSTQNMTQRPDQGSKPGAAQPQHETKLPGTDQPGAGQPDAARPGQRPDERDGTGVAKGLPQGHDHRAGERPGERQPGDTLTPSRTPEPAKPGQR